MAKLRQLYDVYAEQKDAIKGWGAKLWLDLEVPVLTRGIMNYSKSLKRLGTPPCPCGRLAARTDCEVFLGGSGVEGAVGGQEGGAEPAVVQGVDRAAADPAARVAAAAPL